jgi:succinate dehydrogenase/fumarate reductase flavoprotein subunit
MSVGLPEQGQTTKSYWLQDGANPLARHGADSAFTDEQVDIVVIGSGITGVSAVHHLMQGLKIEKYDQLKVVLLEARDFCESHTRWSNLGSICHGPLQVLVLRDVMAGISSLCHTMVLYLVVQGRQRAKMKAS